MGKKVFKNFLKHKKDKLDESKVLLSAQLHGIKKQDSLRVTGVWKAIRYLGAENKANQSIIFSVISWIVMSNTKLWLWKIMFMLSLIGVIQQMRNVWEVQKLIKQ